MKKFLQSKLRQNELDKEKPTLNALTPEMSSEEEFIPEVEFIQEEEFISEEKPKIFPPLPLEPPLPGNPPLPLEPTPPGNPPIIKQDIIEQEYKQGSEPSMSFQEELPKVVSVTQTAPAPNFCKKNMLRGSDDEEKLLFWIRTQNASSKEENIENAVPVTYMQEEQLLVPTVPPPVLEHKPIICRTFHLHGSCSRNSCKHHHVDHPTMEQVRSAFVFCQNFQRSECSIPYCTLLHANTMEEMHFYRTRELPPSCLSKVSSISKQDNIRSIREYEEDMKIRKATAPSFQEALPKLVPLPKGEPKPALCRLNHLFGTCERSSSCQYLHTDIPTDSQVRNAFIFCYNFQFKVCNDKSCKDIHATLAEEIIFYSTRKLPPYVSSSIIKQEMISKCKGKAAPEPKKKRESTVCRSYLRGRCERQNYCKYRHENNPTLEDLHRAFVFCHNFQNLMKCPLENCSFIHATHLEETHFYETKELPPHVFSHIPRKEMIFGPAFLYPERIKHNEKMAAFEEANKKIALVLRNLCEPVSKAWGKDVDQEVAALLAKWDLVVLS